jgi:hypothetical protein
MLAIQESALVDPSSPTATLLVEVVDPVWDTLLAGC